MTETARFSRRSEYTGTDPDLGSEIWLVRHAESEGNASGRLQGQAEFPLSQRGRLQAEALAIRLRSQHFAALYSSDLSRALDTALPVARGLALPPITDPRLREIDVGTWAGLTPQEIAARHPDEWNQWSQRRDPTFRRGGGESYIDLRSRAETVMTELARRHHGERVLIISHGGLINAYLASILGMSLKGLWRITQENTAINRVQPFAPSPHTGAGVTPGRLLVINDHTHLDGI